MVTDFKLIQATNGKTRGRATNVSTTTILVVEDNEFVAGMLKELLESQGWHVDRCAGGTEALERIVGNTKYDLLLLDYDLPGLNGLELVHRARRLGHRSTTPIVMLSATPVRAAACDAGADVFLQKPQDIESLVQTITALT